MEGNESQSLNPNESARIRDVNIARQDLETPLGMRRLTDSSGGRSFSGFMQERGNVRRIVEMEREIRALKELVSNVFQKYNELHLESINLRKLNNETKKRSECPTGRSE